jgi:flagellar protein FliS
MTGGLQTYRAVSVTTMNRGELLLAMYEGGLSFLRQAVAAHDRNDLERFSHFLRRGQDVITELMSTINPGPAPELAARLEGLYEFMIFQLSEANLTRGVEPVRQVTARLARIYDAYRQVILNPTPEVQAVLAGTAGRP